MLATLARQDASPRAQQEKVHLAHMEAAMRWARRSRAAVSAAAPGLRLLARPSSKRAATVGVTERGTSPPFFWGVLLRGDAPNLAAAAAGPDTCSMMHTHKHEEISYGILRQVWPSCFS